VGVAPAGGFVVVSDWMTERERCVGRRLAEAPQVSLTAVLDLHTLLRSKASAPDRPGTIGADAPPAPSEEARPPGEDAVHPELVGILGPGVTRWEDVPAALRDRVRELLAALRRQAAGRARPAEADHDE
jgi:hypothetical protein